jgi:CheY-like chemotaxis protein
MPLSRRIALRSALRFLSQTADLVVSDVKMPGLDGLSAFRIKDTSSIPPCLVTANASGNRQWRRWRERMTISPSLSTSRIKSLSKMPWKKEP